MNSDVGKIRIAATNLDALRIVDVNANRAAEGLRVVEEHLRFSLDDVHLTGQVKKIRHQLTAALSAIPASRRAAARDTLADVGVAISGPNEFRRESAEDVVAANLKRAQQALRCIEEYGKLIDPDLAVAVEPLRYQLYVLEKALQTTIASLAKLAQATLYVLIDGGRNEQDFLDRARQLVESGVDMLQLRDKRLHDRDLLRRARALARLTRPSDTLFIMNDRADLAALSGADGVHCGQEELPVLELRRIVGPDAIVGVSTHSLDQARKAVLDGANYLGCGPTFASPTKQFDIFPGLQYLEDVHREIRLPAFAIGGITEENLARVLSTGAHRVAVSQAIWGSDNIGQRVKAMRQELAATPAPEVD